MLNTDDMQYTTNTLGGFPNKEKLKVGFLHFSILHDFPYYQLFLKILQLKFKVLLLWNFEKPLLCKCDEKMAV